MNFRASIKETVAVLYHDHLGDLNSFTLEFDNEQHENKIQICKTVEVEENSYE
jgi:hypothetical protein